VKTSSGATAVQIARKHHGVRTIIDHIGSAHDDAQLAVLMQIAKERIAAGQLAFDLDGLTSGSSMTAAPTVAGSTSRVLWEVLEGAYARLGFDSVDDDVFRSLVLARVVEPTSKADTIRVLGELGVPTPSLRTIWRTIGAASNTIGVTRSAAPRTPMPPKAAACLWCSTTSPPCIS